MVCTRNELRHWTMAAIAYDIYVKYAKLVSHVFPNQTQLPFGQCGFSRVQAWRVFRPESVCLMLVDFFSNEIWSVLVECGCLMWLKIWGFKKKIIGTNSSWIRSGLFRFSRGRIERGKNRRFFQSSFFSLWNYRGKIYLHPNIFLHEGYVSKTIV